MLAKKLRTLARLGLPSLVRVGTYRLGLKTGLHPVLKLKADVAHGPFFRASERLGSLPAANTAWDDAMWWFGSHSERLPDGAPDWFYNPFADLKQPDASRDWWDIPDFAASDIKGLWELSRFDWVVAWATKAAHGDAAALDRLNHWLSDWAQSNPPYKGPNWKCAQEASIRVMHLVTAAWVLGQESKPNSGLPNLIVTHLQRIALTTSYAIGQQNNHGTSEAAALFVGGGFLKGYDDRAAKWEGMGRALLEERALSLIEQDGSFSQYSVTYHRVMLDSYSLAEAWRRRRDLPSFSDKMLRRLKAAALWLETMTVADTGDAPNIGTNDGARFIPLTPTDHRDFRPSVQLATALFAGRAAFGDGPWNAALAWLNVPTASKREQVSSASFDDGGYHVLRSGKAMAVLRYPRFRFRPSQADALHLDLWRGGENLLRDAGTFSYNAEGAEWFASAAAHNTITFDGRDQMVRLGRFLFGDWLKTDTVETVCEEQGAVSAAASYTDQHGARHNRSVTLTGTGLICRDTISGQFEEAHLRWRLAPGNWVLDGNAVRLSQISLSCEVEGQPDVLPILRSTRESRYYQASEQVPQIEIAVRGPATIITEVRF